MKESIRKKILFFTLIYFGTVLILMLVNLKNASISFNFTYEYSDVVKDLKVKANSLPINNCSNYIKDLIIFVEKTSFNKVTNLKDIYNEQVKENKSILSYYTKGIEACNVSDKDKNKLNDLFTSAFTFGDAIFDKYYFAYELSIKDSFRKLNESTLTGLYYKGKKNTEFSIIETYLEIAKKEVSNEN